MLTALALSLVPCLPPSPLGEEAFGKFWFQGMLNHNRVMQELKRTQLALLEQRGE